MYPQERASFDRRSRRLLQGGATVALAGFVFSVGAQQAPAASAMRASSLTLGVGVPHLPRYEVSDDYRSRALPLIDYRNGRFSASTLGGLRYDFSPTPQWSFGPLLAYRPGRDQDDAPQLRGLGDIDDGADLGAFFVWRPNPFFVHGTVRHPVGADFNEELSVRLGAGYALHLTPSDRIVFDASVEWADEEMMRTRFGVTPEQSARSGLPTYRPEGGMRRASIGAAWNHALGPRWSTTVSVAAVRLGNEAADSPISVNRNGGIVSAGIAYRFR